MRVMFFGTPEFALETLIALEKKHTITAVFTQPDRKKGRGHKYVHTPVKEYAISRGYDVYQPEKISGFDLVDLIESTKTDIAVVVAYGQKIPKRFLCVPKHAFINVHASLLPKLRGAAPIERCIIDGEQKTGITIMYMAEGMDTGDIGIQREIALDDTITGGELTDKLSVMGAEMAVEFLDMLECGVAPRIPQDSNAATHAGKILKEDLSIDFDMDCNSVLNKIRAFAPSLGVKITINGVESKVYKAKKVDIDESPSSLGAICSLDTKRLIVAFGDGWIEIEEIQPASKGRMSGAEFIRGYVL